MKIAAATRRSDVGGVALGIGSPQAAATRSPRSAPPWAMRHRRTRREFLVQADIDGMEMIIGVTHDPAFGPIVLAGLGGTTVEVIGDVAVRITPLSNTDVDEMLRSLRSYRLLTGYRQTPPLDVAAFAELLHRVSNINGQRHPRDHRTRPQPGIRPPARRGRRRRPHPPHRLTGSFHIVLAWARQAWRR